MAEPSLIYKVTILYLLSRSDEPLSDTALQDFFLDHDYTDYFGVRTALRELSEAEMITADESGSRTNYTITESGQESAVLMADKLTDDIRFDADHFLHERQIRLKQEAAVSADFCLTQNGQYRIRCKVLSDQTASVDLTLTVPSLRQAEAVAKNWKKHYIDIYSYLMDILIQ